MYIPEAHAVYFNPTRNLVPGAILRAHFQSALEDTPVGQPGVTFPLLLEQDIPTPWLGIHAKPVTAPVVQPTYFTVKEALERKAAERKARGV